MFKYLYFIALFMAASLTHEILDLMDSGAYPAALERLDAPHGLEVFTPDQIDHVAHFFINSSRDANDDDRRLRLELHRRLFVTGMLPCNNESYVKLIIMRCSCFHHRLLVLEFTEGDLLRQVPSMFCSAIFTDLFCTDAMEFMNHLIGLGLVDINCLCVDHYRSPSILYLMIYYGWYQSVELVADQILPEHYDIAIEALQESSYLVAWWTANRMFEHVDYYPENIAKLIHWVFRVFDQQNDQSTFMRGHLYFNFSKYSSQDLMTSLLGDLAPSDVVREQVAIEIGRTNVTA